MNELKGFDTVVYHEFGERCYCLLALLLPILFSYHCPPLAVPFYIFQMISLSTVVTFGSDPDGNQFGTLRGSIYPSCMLHYLPRLFSMISSPSVLFEIIMHAALLRINLIFLASSTGTTPLYPWVLL